MDRSVVSGLAEIASLKSRNSRSIKGSRLSIGFETLDRQMFKPEPCYDLIAATGVKWARCQTGWNRCETVKGQLDFGWLDEVVDNLLRRGIQPWFNVGYGNKLYMPDAPHESAVGSVPLYYPQETQDAWRRFVRELARHFQGRVRHFEIWNECNIDCFWRPGTPAAGEYTRFVALSAKEIRGVVPESKIVACVAGSFSQFVLDTLKTGIGDSISAYAIHPYGNIPEVNLAHDVAGLRAQLAKYAPHVQIWQGECGCPSQTLGHHDDWLGLFNMDQTKQAKWLLRRLLLDLELDLELVSYFHAADLMEQEYRQASGQVRPPVMMGVLHGKTYTPKLSHATLGGVCALFDEDTEPRRLLAHVDAQPGRCESKLGAVAVQTRTFERRGLPLYAYYLPEDVQLETPVRSCSLSILDDATHSLEEPVLLDLVQMKVFAVPAASGPANVWSYRSFAGLPLADYPLILADRRALDLPTATP